MHPVVELASILRRRQDGGRTFELFVPHLAVAPGRFVAVVGPSGSGKSTLLDMLGLVLQPTEGARFTVQPQGEQQPFDILELWQQQRDTALADLRRRYFGYVIQTGGLLSFLNVTRNVGLARRLIGAQAPAQEIAAVLSELGLEGQGAKRPASLSGGERQRVAIARALFHKPAIILADEPTAAVDRERARDIVQDFKRRASAEHATVLMVTHDLNLVEGVADDWVHLRPDRTAGDAKTVRYVCEQMEVA
ncbi:ABC transporter ATP-binding protein [Candidatus Entotheonella palauensis]|uniref:ABC transporter ATP-binding protein n=1 Tax=Candidatus Entotheonella palauensis TaxID=93172 RepID=UPI000B7CB3E1|nr:ABC transporter ATP-binding protein [Candidatus Entotheonella palauensis]